MNTQKSKTKAKMRLRSQTPRQLVEEYKKQVRGQNFQPILMRVINEKTELSLLEIMHNLGGK
jgi:hypothetical protein